MCEKEHQACTRVCLYPQNLGEAEYAVAIYMYMRLQGYPPDKIAILTTYNGQKHLIRDVLTKRCAKNPVFGLPEKASSTLASNLIQRFPYGGGTVDPH